MANVGYMAITLLVAVIFIIAIMGVYKKIDSYSGAGYLIFMYLFLFLHIFFFVVYNFEPVENAALRYYMLMDAAEAAAMAAMLLFLFRFTNPFVPIRPWFVLNLAIIPVAAVIAAVTNHSHGLMYQAIEIVQIYPSKLLLVEKGLFCYVTEGFTAICSAASLFLLVNRFRRSSVFYRGQALMFISGVAAFILFDLLHFFRLNEAVNMSVVGSTILAVTLYAAYASFKSSDLMFLARDAVYERISSVAFVIENNGRILDCNPAAVRALRFHTGPIPGEDYDRLVDRWIAENKGERVNEDGKMTFSVEDGGSRSYYDVAQSDIQDAKGRKIGVFIEMRDVTKQQSLIQELFHLVHYDQLTNLYNRRYFDKMCEEYNDEKYLPLSIVSGDLNLLKATNDQHGHIVGDRLITVTGHILQEAAPEGAVVSRHGGDEFMALLPHCGEEEAKAYLARVHELCKNHYEEPFGSPSIALGYAVKTDTKTPVREIILDADLFMYRLKRQSREDSREQARPYHQPGV